MTAPRVLFVANDPPGRAVYRYRCENLMTALLEKGVSAETVYVGQPRIRVEHDVVVLHRICTTAIGKVFARAARRCGAALVYSTDDLVFEETAFGTGAAFEKFRRYASLHREMLQQADAVLVSTDFLSERVTQTAPAKPVFTVRNFLSPELRAISEAAAAKRKHRSGEPGRRKTLAYLSGSATHDSDLAVIAEPLRKLLESRPDTDLLLVGPVTLPEGLNCVSGQVRRHPFVSWRELPDLMASEIDVNLAPLDLALPFTHAKSEIKWLEAAAVGVPTLATNGAGFAECLATADRGDFLADSSDEWFQRSNEMLDDPIAAGEKAANLLSGMRRHREAVKPVFDTLSELSPAVAGKGTWVNWPAAPPRYLIKSVLERMKP